MRHVRIYALPPSTVPAHKQPQLAPSLWPEIAERARYESLRDLAAEYGVSHEAIRGIVRRVAEREIAVTVA